MNIILIIATAIAVIIGWLIYSTDFWERVQELSARTTAEAIGEKVKSLDENIGETELVCPACGEELVQKPSPKGECPHCGIMTYNRKRPFDNRDVLVTEEELVKIQEQWAIVNGEHDKFLKEQKRKERIKDHIKEQTGRKPTLEEIEVVAMQQQAEELEQSGDWGLARNKRMNIADRLQDNGETEKALKVYLEVCYLDANGPRNLSKIPPDENSSAFSEDAALLAPGVLKKVVQLVKKLDLDLDKLKNLYLKSAERTYQRINEVELPKMPTEAWDEFRDTIT